MGTCAPTPKLFERYEYTPYGQRTIYSRNWLLEDVNDDGVVNDHDKDLVYNARGTSDKDSRYDLDGDGNVDDCDVSLANAAIGNAVASDDLVMYPVLDCRRGRGPRAGETPMR